MKRGSNYKTNIQQHFHWCIVNHVCSCWFEEVTFLHDHAHDNRPVIYLSYIRSCQGRKEHSHVISYPYDLLRITRSIQGTGFVRQSLIWWLHFLRIYGLLNQKLTSHPQPSIVLSTLGHTLYFMYNSFDNTVI